MIVDELGRDVRRLAQVVRRRLGDVLHRDHERRLAVVRDLARQDLVRHDADGVDVAARVRRASERLLGRHVVGSPHHHAVERELLGRLSAREPEVEDRDGPAVLDHDVLRLEVAMDDAELVRGFGPEGDLPEDRDRACLGQLSLELDDRPQVLARNVFHRDVGEVVAHSEVVDARHVRVLDLPVEIDLALEPEEELLVVGLPVGRQDLDGDDVVEIQILRLEDDSHAAAADGLLPSVARQSLEEALAEAFQVHAFAPERRSGA